MQYREFYLDSFQEKGFQTIDQEISLIVSAPTGAGKTLIAEYAVDKALTKNRTIIYTSPLKALSNQKFRDFGRLYGSHRVGIMTGDVTIQPEAPILVMTTEIFRNSTLETPDRFSNALYVIFDEIHYLDDSTRGTVWEESIIFAPLSTRLMCLSATIPNLDDLAGWIRDVRHEDIVTIRETQRPVPLTEYFFVNGPRLVKKDGIKNSLLKSHGFSFNPQGLSNFIIRTIEKARHFPCLFFFFSRKDCEFHARRHSNKQFLSKEDRERVEKIINDLSQKYETQISPEDKGLGSFLVRGVGYHHAGMLPSHKEIVEYLFTLGLIKLLFTTETFAMGVNMPATSVVFSGLKKFDGIGVRDLKAIEYQQISGRAGRRGMDKVGFVYTNLLGEKYKLENVNKICSQYLEPIESQFNLSYSTILNLYGRLREDLVLVSDKSFGTYVQNLKNKKKKKSKYAGNEAQRKELKKKLSFLKLLGYINQDGLTSKGSFASKINGYEIVITEIFYEGWMEELDETKLFTLLVSIVFEGKKGGGDIAKRHADLKKLIKYVNSKVESIRSLEHMLGIKEEVKAVDFRLTPLCKAWSDGEDFEKIRKSCSLCSEGDLIRYFRQAIQILRQIRKATYGYEGFTNIIDRTLMRVNRGEFNAENQLRVSY